MSLCTLCPLVRVTACNLVESCCMVQSVDDTAPSFLSHRIEGTKKTVRSDLISEFENEVGRANVTQISFLDVEIHGRAILRSLFRHSSSSQTSSYDSQSYCIIALYAYNVGHGAVVGDRTAPFRLVVLNDSDTHFDPCMPL